MLKPYHAPKKEEFWSRRPYFLPVAGLLATVFAPTLAHAYTADHLVVSEVGYDVANEPTTAGSASAEFIEIFNPTNLTIVLNNGAVPGTANSKGSYFLTDSPTNYFNVVNASVSMGSTNTDTLLQFPEGATIAPGGTIVVCSDSTQFFNQLFAGDTAGFSKLPGNPQLFETTQDTDSIPDMVYRSTYSSTSTPHTLNLTNGGEPAILFYWDGVSDLIQDVDIVVWVNSAQVVNKDAFAISGIDGPDDNITASFYQADEAQTTSLGYGVVSGQGDLNSLQRLNILEPNETGTGGNGFNGNDETSEEWGNLVDSSANPAWVMARHSPGLVNVRLNSSISDAVSFLEPVAVSSADGPNGTADPADYGADGTLTELYLTTIDSNADRVIDSLYFAIRGSFFGEPDSSDNGTVLFVDVDPGNSTGVSNIAAAGNELSDSSGTLDTSITLAGISLDASVYTSMGFDVAAGLEVAAPASSDTAGWRSWDSTNSSGTTSIFAELGAYSNVAFDGNLSADFAGATGTSYAAADGMEGIVTLTSLTNPAPTYVFAVAMTTAGNGTSASPNTLPESSGNSLSAFPQPLEYGVCFELASGKALLYYVDADEDGYGSSTLANYCGADTATVSTISGDCNDNASTQSPATAEFCDGADNDCDGQSDEDVTTRFYQDFDDDGYGDNNSFVDACSAPIGYVSISEDCDDENPNANPAEVEVCDDADNDCDGLSDEAEELTYFTLYVDSDNDGYGTGSGSLECDVPNGYSLLDGDCDDSDVTISPAATEVCDSIDNDCDGITDDGVTLSFYLDSDEDTFGENTTSASGCTVPEGYVSSNNDCDDSDALTYPGATERCDGVDNNCDGSLANEADDDGDSYRLCNNDCDDTNALFYPGATELCDGFDTNCDATIPANEADADGDNQRICDGDCDDSDAQVNTGAVETCDRNDNNCNGAIDEGVTLTFYLDIDNDGYGSTGSTFAACTVPDGYATVGGDCAVNNDQIYPGATEVCDSVDNDCDSSIDEGVKSTFYLDSDSDGYGSSSNSTLACTAPPGYVSNAADCDDISNAIHPLAQEVCDSIDNDCDGDIDDDDDSIAGQNSYFEDSDLDGFGNASGTSTLTCASSAPTGYSSNDDDCDDTLTTAHPGGTEVCNLKDDDCDGSTDEGVQSTFYRDVDGDGYGTAATTTSACSVPPGYSTTNDDCDDSNQNISPSAAELCDSVDNNCNASIDEGVLTTFYTDGDGDGYGRSSSSVEACTAPAGTSNHSDDCNDANAAVYPGAAESCDAIDNDCDSIIDEGVTSTFYQDLDDDGHGTTELTLQACTATDGFATVSDDCDDSDKSIYPGAPESCDGKDNDCDNSTDEDGDSLFYVDNDDDGFGDSSQSLLTCFAPDGYVSNAQDCNDADDDIHPDAVEICDAIDNDCDTEIDGDDDSVVGDTRFYVDLDGDGFGNLNDSGVLACDSQGPTGYSEVNSDCNDNNASVNPNAVESCNGIDDNCDNTIDENLTSTYYRDQDEDGYGGATTLTACTAPSGYATVAGDCNDLNAKAYPGAVESCDNVDNDCDDLVDESVTQTYFADADHDGQGGSTSTQACDAPTGYVASTGDCDDNNDSVNSSASEACDGVDTNCDGTIPPNELDSDDDGVASCAGDCDDTNSTVYPNAQEVCNGINDDCNAATLETSDLDGDSYTVCQGDCNDSNAAVSPSASEICDGVDNDCNTLTSEVNDDDSDGYSECTGDCNDANAAIHSSAFEACNSIDDNCNNRIDEGYALDADGDGYSNADCGGLDCNDQDEDISPDADDIPNDSIDQDCSGDDAIDADQDGYADDDCDDNNAAVHPADDELLCYDDLDNDCDDLTDDEDADCAPDTIDSDQDGLLDSQEAALGTNPTDSDTDDDSLSDFDEVVVYATDPTLADSDADSLSDPDEINTYNTDPILSDSDEDGLTDGEEVLDYSTNPNDPDSDRDDLSDAAEVGAYDTNPNDSDSDDDQLTDGQEIALGTNPLDSDMDDDGLLDSEEIALGTDPENVDTDGDGFSDAEEVDSGTDPVDPNSYPNGDDDDTSGDDDTEISETPIGDDDTDEPTDAPGDDDASAPTEPPGDDDATAGDDDTSASDDSPTPEETPAPDDDGTSTCQCSTEARAYPPGTDVALLLLALGMLLRRRKNKSR